MNTSTAVKLMAGVVAGVLAWKLFDGAKQSLQNLLSDPSKIGEGVVTVADDVVAGVVEAIGGAVGVPVTNQSRCDAAKAAGNIGDASLYCTAPDFMKWVAAGRPSGGASGSW